MKATLASALVFGVTAALATPVSGASEPNLKSAANASPEAIERLYADHTWKWKDGAAYFAPDGRFLAWHEGRGQRMYALGRWKIYRWGNLCFFANWNFGTGTREETKCFDHRVLGGDIYQRTGKAAWYLFKGASAEGEHGRFQSGNQLQQTFDEIRAGIQLQRPQAKRR